MSTSGEGGNPERTNVRMTTGSAVCSNAPPGRAMGTVLLVEDDAQCRAVISTMLHSRGIEADVATDSAAAASLLDRHQYCAILLDLVLGEGSGFDVLAHIRERGIDTPTIVISGKLADYTREVLALYDVVHVVYAKPADPETLARIVLAFCDTSGAT